MVYEYVAVLILEHRDIRYTIGRRHRTISIHLYEDVYSKPIHRTAWCTIGVAPATTEDVAVADAMAAADEETPTLIDVLV